MSFSRHQFFLAGENPLPTHCCVLLATFLLTLLVPVREAQCAKIAWWQHPQREQVEIVFSQDMPAPDVRRIDPLTVRILAGRDAWEPIRELTLPAFTGANLLQALVPEGDGLLVRLQSKAFGFVTQYDEMARRLTVDFFPDPLGGRWLFDPPRQNIQAQDRTTRPDPPQPPAAVAPSPSGPALPAPFQDAQATDMAGPPMPESEGVLIEILPDTEAVRGPVQAPVLRAVPEPSATPQLPGVLRSRIEQVGPEDARPATPVSERPAMVADDPVTPEERPQPAKIEPGEALSDDRSDLSDATPIRREISRVEMTTRDAEPEQSEQHVTEPISQEEAAPAAKLEEPQPSEPSGTVETEPTDPAENYRKRLANARAAMMNAEFEEAVRALRGLASMADLPDDLREDVLYDLADALFSLYQDDLANNFAEVAGAYEQAMNVNPRSPRAATALRNLGVAHLRVNNLPEAKAFFNVLRQEYPHDPLVPTAEYYLGDYYYERGDYGQAADHFQIVVEKYPEHAIAQQSSIGLARALYALGFDDRAFQIMDFLEKRWPRYYIDDPSVLELAGIIALRVNSLESAKQRLSTYYNLVPDTPDAHMLLARLGDIYLLTGKPDAARHVFEKAAREFPDEEGGLIAQMRLVEGGIHDDPSLEDVFASLRAAQVYTHIIDKHPQSPLAAVATIKLAIWQVWNKRLEDSLSTIRDFLANRAHHSLAPKALEIGMEAFSQLVDRNLEDGRYPEIIEQWQLNPFLHPLEAELSPQTTLGLAMGFWKTGDHERAIQLARPYLDKMTPQQAQGFALDLVLGILLEQQQWERIADLEPLRKELELSPDRLRELNYALALALENLNRTDEAGEYWLGLAQDLQLTEAQRGYALYFLARKALQDEDLEKVYLYAQEALSLLLLERKDSGKIRDCIAWLTQVTQRTGRLQEALAWALEFDQLIDEDDPDWAMSRYRLAQLYQRMQNQDQWRKVLVDLQQKDPRGLYGRLAGSALQGRELEDNVGRFQQ